MSPTEPEEKMSEQNKPEQPEHKDAEQATSEQGQGVPETSEPDQVSPDPGEYELEETIDEAGRNSYSQGALVRRRFLHHKGAMAASIILLLVIVLAFSSSLWWPKNHVDLYPLAKANGAPTFQLWPFSLGENPFGQNTIGKDYFALVMQGTQKSVIIAFVVGFIGDAGHPEVRDHRLRRRFHCDRDRNRRRLRCRLLPWACRISPHAGH